MQMFKILVIWLGKVLLWATRLRGGAGSAFPGLVVETIYPNFIKRMVKGLSGGSILVTGTNGKTTTTKMLRGVLEDAGHRPLSNRAGGNLSRGVASALIEHADWRGRLDGDVGLFEIDEAFTGDVAQKLCPRTIVVLNLLRDQLDRYGELDRTAQLIAAGLPYAQTAVLNADDPLVAGLAEAASKVISFGASDKIRALLPHDEELLTRKPGSRSKPRQQQPPIGNLDLRLSSVEVKSGQQNLTIQHEGKVYGGTLQIQGLYNAYNALAAVAAASSIGINIKAAIASLAKAEPAFGRTELIEVGDKKLQLLLVKNPAGFNQVIRTFLMGSRQQSLLIAINDNFADGRDVSWLWDVDFEQMQKQDHQTLTSGIRGYDLAVRLKYADTKSTTELNLASALDQFMADLPPGATGFVIPTYTAMLALRQLLARRFQVKKVWQ